MLKPGVSAGAVVFCVPVPMLTMADCAGTESGARTPRIAAAIVKVDFRFSDGRARVMGSLGARLRAVGSIMYHRLVRGGKKERPRR